MRSKLEKARQQYRKQNKPHTVIPKAKQIQINDSNLKTTLYQTLVRLRGEYASSVLDPYANRNIDRLEMVQLTTF